MWTLPYAKLILYFMVQQPEEVTFFQDKILFTLDPQKIYSEKSTY